MILASENYPAAKKSGRRPLEEGKRRVQFGTRVAPETLQGLESLAKSRNDNLGRVIDFLVEREIKHQLGETAS